MPVFDLSSKVARDTIKEIISDLASETQLAIQETTGQRIFLVKNTPLINTAIDKAAETIDYHGIRADAISNEKKYAHVCFWLLKLSPISYVGNIPVMGGRIVGTAQTINLTEAFPHIPVNTEIAYRLFVSLYCMNNFDASEVTGKVKSMISAKYSTEVMRSLRFHNYSARSMAMFLETLMMDKLS